MTKHELMKKSFILLLASSLLFSCAKKHEETLLYYPSKESFENHEMRQINLDNDRLTYKKIIDSIRASEKHHQYLYFETKENDTLRKIILWSIGPEVSNQRRFLIVNQDSVLIGPHYSFKELPRLLKLHYENKDQRYYRSHNLPYLFVGIEMKDSIKGSVLKKTMITVAKAFDQLKQKPGDSLHLKMHLFYTPPLPPDLARPKREQ